MKQVYAVILSLAILLFHESVVFAQCEAVTGGTGNGNTISSLPSCGSSTGSVDVPHTGYVQLTGLEVNGRYTVNIAGGTGANYITVRQGTPTGGSVTAWCSSCTSLTFTATSSNHYVVVNANGCPGNWSSTSAALSYTRLNPPTPTLSVTYDCNNNTTISTSGADGSFQWQGNTGSSWVDISGATNSSYTITNTTNPQYNQYRIRSSYASCHTFSASAFVVPRNNFTGDVVVSSNVTLGGEFNINGNFTLNSGVTITTVSNCVLNINAIDITINGTIDANGRGASGGAGGNGGAYGLASDGNCVRGGQGGAGGAAGSGSGGGGAGGNGGNGSYHCQSCGGFLCIGNSDGCVGGGGGGGGGRGGSYGGQGGVGGYGAVGNSLSQTPCTFCFIGSTCSASGGSSGSGGSGGGTYGTDTGTDIAVGSGGGGAGGGGGGWANGTNGGSGGAGGGGVRLNASRDITVAGTITANGANGGSGGTGSGNSTDNVRDCYADPYDCCSICSSYCVWDAGGGNGGGAGGGSGGGIYIAGARHTVVTGTLSANGGNGGSAPTNSYTCWDNSRGGGGGGGGRIKIFRNPCGNNNISPSTLTYNGGNGGSGPVTGAAGNQGTYNIINHPSFSALSPGTISSNQTICSGGTPSAFTGTAASGGLAGNYTYNWFSCTGGSCPTPTSGNSSPGTGWTDRGTNATGFTETSTLTSTTTYVRRVISGTCIEWSNIITVTVVADPSASTPSFTNATICVGGSTTVSSTISGGTGTPTYQWQFFNGSSWVNVANNTPAGATYTGATTTSMTISGITATGAHQYRISVSFSGSGCDATTSSASTLTVVADPSATTPSFTNATICAGGSTTVSSTISGGTGTPTYQWQFFDGSSWVNVANGTPAGANYSGATTTSMTISGITATGAHQYRISVSFSGSGCDATTSSASTLTVVADPSATTPSFTNATICVGGSTTVSSTISGGTGTPTYQWQFFDGSSWVNVANNTPAGATYTGATTTSMTISGITATGSHQYRISVSFSGSGCDATTSSASTLTVVADPSATTPSFTNATICVGGSTTVSSTISGGTGTPTYQWQFFNGSSWVNVANGTPAGATYTGATTTSMTISGITATGAHQYRISVSFSGSGCDATTSSASTLTVVADPSATTPSFTNATICVGGSTTVSSTISGGTGTPTYQWQFFDGSSWVNVANGTPAGATYTGATTTSMTISGITATGAHQYRISVSFSGSGCDATTSSASTLTVVADPSATTPSFTNATICVGGSTTVSSTISGGTGTPTYQWQFFDGSSWVNVANNTPAGATYTGATTTSMTISGITATGSHQYRISVSFSGSGCDATTSSGASFNVIADPTWATNTVTPTTACVGVPITLNATVNGGAGNIISWVRALTSGGSGTTVTSPDIPATAGTYYYRPQYSSTVSGCDLADGTETTVTIQQPSLSNINASVDPDMSTGDYLWNGLNSDNWNTANNWYVLNGSNFQTTTSIPDSTKSVYIVSNFTASNCVSATNVATISNTSNANSVYIDNDATLIITGTNVLNVYGNWISESASTFTSNNSTVQFTGNSDREIYSNGKLFHKVNISKPAGRKVRIETNFETTDKTTIISGTLEVPGGISGKVKQVELQPGGNLNILSNGQFKVNE